LTQASKSEYVLKDILQAIDIFYIVNASGVLNCQAIFFASILSVFMNLLFEGLGISAGLTTNVFYPKEIKSRAGLYPQQPTSYAMLTS